MGELETWRGQETGELKARQSWLRQWHTVVNILKSGILINQKKNHLTQGFFQGGAGGDICLGYAENSILQALMTQ